MVFELSSEELLGIKIMALLNSGLLILPEDFAGDYEIDLRMFVSPSDMEDFDYQLNANPFDYVPNNILLFIDEYTFNDRHPNAISSYAEVNPRYWLSEKLYAVLMNKFEIIRMKQDSKKRENKHYDV